MNARAFFKFVVVVAVLLLALVLGLAAPVLAAPLGQALSAETPTLGAIVTGLGIISTLLYALVEYLVAPFLYPDGGLEQPDYIKERRKTIIQVVVAAFGVAVTLLYGIDMLGVALAKVGIMPVTYPLIASIFGQVLTGLLIGKGSNWFHDIVGGFGLS
jgi:hypothetical protein